MIEPTSRYYGLSKTPLTYTFPDGRQVIYLDRRFLPPSASLPVLGQVVAQTGERLDLFAARTLGDPEAFWRICDANDAMNPFDLTAGVSAPLRVPLVLR